MKKLKLILVFIICSVLLYFIIYRFLDSFVKNGKFDGAYVCGDCNLILISIDTLRQDSMGIYGYNKNTTPYIDEWAKKALVFTNMRTEVPYTYPSFSILFTGISTYNSKIANNPIPSNDKNIQHPSFDATTTTLAQKLKAKEYITAAFINSPPLYPGRNIEKGFDTYKVGELRRDIENGIGDFKSSSNVLNGIEWLKAHKDKKFFLWIHMMEPHMPYMPPPKYQCIFGKEFCSIINQEGLMNLEEKKQAIIRCQEEPLPDETVNLYKTLYDGGIGAADELTGEILEVIKNTGLDKKTIVVLYGDHGEGFDHNYYFFHGKSLYDSGVKIPFIIKSPNSIGKKISEPLQNIQIYATLLDMLGLKAQDGDEIGRSFKSITDGKEYKADPYRYYMAYKLRKFAIEDGNYKYIVTENLDECSYKGQGDELYNLKNDPNETVNLYDKEQEISRTLKDNLLEKIKRSGFQEIIPNAYIPYSNQTDKIQDFNYLGY